MSFYLGIAPLFGQLEDCHAVIEEETFDTWHQQSEYR